VKLSTEASEFMRLVSSRLGLSARVFDRLLKVSRTIADLNTSDQVEKVHLAEAVQYRESGDR
jgi:magnesium chelatase family protein